MPEQQTLIDQALAVVADAQPVGFGDSIPISPKQAMVWGVYLAEQDHIAGRGTEAAVEKYAASARSVGSSCFDDLLGPVLAESAV